jgi:hypothetical protein
VVSPKNLLSIGLIIGKNHIAIFDFEKCVMVLKNNPKVVITQSNKDSENGLYMLDIKNATLKMCLHVVIQILELQNFGTTCQGISISTTCTSSPLNITFGH